MPYTKTVWQRGDVISSEKLNKIEQGIEDASSSSGGGAFIIEGTNVISDSSTLTFTIEHEKTLQETLEACKAGKQIYCSYSDNDRSITISLNSVYAISEDNQEIKAFTGYGKIISQGIPMTIVARFVEDYAIVIENCIDLSVEFTYDQQNEKYVCNYSPSTISMLHYLNGCTIHGILTKPDGDKCEIIYNGITQENNSATFVFQHFTVNAIPYSVDGSNGLLSVGILEYPVVGDITYNTYRFLLTPEPTT